MALDGAGAAWGWGREGLVPLGALLGLPLTPRCEGLSLTLQCQDVSLATPQAWLAASQLQAENIPDFVN